MFYIFDREGKNIGSCDFEPSAEDLATRNEIAIEFNEEFQGDLVLVNNKILVIDKKPSDFHELVNNEWVLPDEKAQQLFEDLKDEKLAELNKASESFVENLIKSKNTPEFERVTWPKQAEEALAWHEDNTVATPTIDKIAKNRKKDVEIVRARAYQKAIIYEDLILQVAGQRQGYEDDIYGSQTLDKLNSIKFEFTYEVPNV
ncbi:hypothetical protein QJU93_07160 [Pasteurella skyensis]|uniref:Uncharacterized protein n=1 Tax=Phocoenobacter skyensis TaxID=97481 RepID=A0AAJ6P0Y8_9PAST|nr:hypothetical protein [Pasteurella skyensis]MDP8173134.1 hypothetical protein [Pasteurella skyensis]MDP8178933.1 hypothetical protein [Pasteurella skyensis]